jgi:glycosidase
MTLEQSLELHFSNQCRNKYSLEDLNYSDTGKLIVNESYQIKEITQTLNTKRNELSQLDFYFKSSDLNALALIEKINHFLIKTYLTEADNLAMKSTLATLNKNYGSEQIDKILIKYCTNFSNKIIYHKNEDAQQFLENKINNIPVRELLLEEIILLKICNSNLAAQNYKELFDDEMLARSTKYTPVFYTILEHFNETPSFGPQSGNLIKMLMEPAQKYPHSLLEQIEYIKEKWGYLTGRFLMLLLRSLDMIKEENKAYFNGPGPTEIIKYDKIHNYEDEHDTPNYSQDSNWMPEVILMAKNSLVWLNQLSRDYKREITTLNQIPDEELETLARRGINCLWLIGIWDRSNASKEIKKRCGNPDAVSSAYSLFSYDIAHELGGWDALSDLRNRCKARGIRLASDMVPNHTGIDSEWTRSRPDWFIQTDRPPFPTYTYNSENLSQDPGIGIYLEDHYYDKSDAAVTFKRVNFHTGETRYIYHGNDGTTMPWNDTAQLDFLQQEVREAVIGQILHVARNFPVIRFDAAMTLAKKHIQRLWYPEPGCGGDIASRSNFALSRDDFEKAVGGEFWKDVVARVANEAPDTLLLAEAFWMMEGYFVRNLGMHRVYNSAFMNMIKNEENGKYRETIKATLNYDRKILKRFVNFMNNPDEETAAVQFGTGDKYFGVLIMMITMPGLPMIGHGQFEGYREKYGMEFKKPLWDEYPDKNLIERHEREVFPILRKRYLFVSAKNFRLYDLNNENGSVNDNVFAYTNQCGQEHVLVLYNNAYDRVQGTIKESVPYNEITNDSSYFTKNTLGEALHLYNDENWYCLLKENKSGKWYIRNNREIFNRGLFLSLDGYENQVFTDIHQLENSTANPIKNIAENLNGEGTQDLDKEYREVLFKPLYKGLNPLFNSEIIKEIEKDSIDFETFSEKISSQVKTAVTSVKMFTEGTGKVDDITQKILLSISQPQKIKQKYKKDKLITAFFNSSFDFNNRLTYYLLSIFENLGSLVNSGEGRKANKDLLDNWMILGHLRDIFTERGYSVELIRSILPKLRFFTESYNPEQKILSGLLNRKNWDKLQKLEGFENIIGLNRFKETLWFSKEDFEGLLWWFFFKNILESKENLSKENLLILEKWQKASEKSDYDFNKFLKLI